MSGLKVPHDAWVVVMDGKKALFLRNEGDEKFIHLQVFEEFEQENPPTREQGADSPGRLNDPLGNRSAVEETDLHQQAEDRFTVEISKRMYERAHKGDFDHLVIIAPPRALGTLRKELHKSVRDRLIAEVDKDLTGHPIDQIEKILTTKI